MPDAEINEINSVKTTRIRLIYEKRGRACFVPHVAMSTLFARAARRADIELSYTDGFSPRAKISFGPELPAGVVALSEPADLWLKGERKQLSSPEEIVSALNEQMPEGFRVTKCFFPAEGALGKECRAAHYLVWLRNNFDTTELLQHMERHYGEAFLHGFVEQNMPSRISAVLADPAQNGIGGWVKILIADGIAAGWHDMCVVRVSLGRWHGKNEKNERNEKHMEPIGDDAACLRIEK